MRTLLTILICTNYCFTQAQESVTLVSDSIINEFIQWEISNTPKYPEDRIIGKKQLFIYQGDWASAFPLNSIQNIDTIKFEVVFSWFINEDTLFSASDKKFIEYQFMNTSRNKWVANFKDANIKKGFRKKTYQLTMPLFSIDKNTVLIHKYFYCGSVCARACTYVYKKVDVNKWELIQEYQCWIG